jgi:hypothetical protein
MPNKDGTGPEGKGSRSGRALGNCLTENSHDETVKYGKGRGLGRRSGNGKGNKNRRRNKCK